VRRTLALNSPTKRAIAFCAIARPNEFFSSLAAAGAEVVERVRFRDHHRYIMADVDRLATLGRRLGCDAFVITAKDEVKLDAAMRLRLNAVAPVYTATLTVELEDEEAVLGLMRKSLIVTAR
jgi:tetraacyldisaccharide 4'-kinase